MGDRTGQQTKHRSDPHSLATWCIHYTLTFGWSGGRTWHSISARRPGPTIKFSSRSVIVMDTSPWCTSVGGRGEWKGEEREGGKRREEKERGEGGRGERKVGEREGESNVHLCNHVQTQQAHTFMQVQRSYTGNTVSTLWGEMLPYLPQRVPTHLIQEGCLR